MSHYWRLALTEELRDIMAKLQAPIPDQYLSWKPGNTFEVTGEWYGIYFPYINREFLEERLDNVLGWLAGILYSMSILKASATAT